MSVFSEPSADVQIVAICSANSLKLPNERDQRNRTSVRYNCSVKSEQETSVYQANTDDQWTSESKRMKRRRDLDFWSIAKRLAEAGKIVPLASRGIIGRSGTENLVYDAETTHGGSGGPVLDINGKVIAVKPQSSPNMEDRSMEYPRAALCNFSRQLSLRTR